MSRKYWSLRRIMVVLIVFAFTTGLLFGGRFLYEKFFQRHPLQKWVRTNPAITSYELMEQGTGLRLELELESAQVENLQEILEPFLREVLVRKEQPVTEILIANEPSPELAEVYYKLSFALEEAKMTGEYNTLYEVLQDLQREAGEADFRIYLGADFLYVQLKKGNENYFRVLPRNEGVQSGLAVTVSPKGGKG
ncbi:MAG TPA: hypothetical protein DD734_02080 [Firmicutes bacterium]|nr:hypothetical protein [Bacillota bacterium]HBR33390.1 hypothetical protein [Bacillota bacterium]